MVDEFELTVPTNLVAHDLRRWDVEILRRKEAFEAQRVARFEINDKVEVVCEARIAVDHRSNRTDDHVIDRPGRESPHDVDEHRKVSIPHAQPRSIIA
jgi:hypothetical protein